ncbi:TPA: autotransporter outer membrane beta-barrel domain-containing protein [Stenotrophomonas maltophilia]|nr:autotransporter outer membrane beta-barrel domain-containing protein [Stenotrophomonas maltophilia]
MEAWTLDGATLFLTPGAESEAIQAGNGSALIIDGSTVTDAGTALQLSDTAGGIIGSTVSGSQAAVLSDGSSFTFMNSTLTATQEGAVVETGSSVNFKNTQVSSSGQEGLAVRDGASVTVDDNSHIRGADHAVTFGQNGAAGGRRSTLTVDGSTLESGSGAAILVDEGGTSNPFGVDIVVGGGSTVNAGNGVLLETRGEVDVNFTVNNSVLVGDVLNGADATTQVMLRNNAHLTGALVNVSSLALDAATWTLDNDSSVGRLDLGNGTIEFAPPAMNLYHTLTVDGDFSGNGGTIIFNTVLAGDDALSDKLVIGGDTSGSANVRVNNVNGSGAQTVNGIELIEVAGASNGQFNLLGRAVGGQYEYFLHKGNGSDGNWYLRSQLPPADHDPFPLPEPGAETFPMPGPQPEDEAFPLPGPDPEGPVLRPEGGAYLANAQAAQAMFQLGYHARQAGQNSGRSWVRVDGSRQGFEAVSRQLDIHGNSQSLAVGTDVWRSDNGLSAGVMVSSGNATSTSTNALSGYYARGKVKGEALGVYGTLRGGQGNDPYAGFYVDGSLQHAQFRNRVEGVALAAERYDTRAWQGAVEGGYAFRVGGASDGGLYVEPQLQVGYSRWNDTRHTEVNGTVVTTDDANGLFGRAGVRLSGVTRWGDGVTEVQPYLAAHWVHNRADLDVRMDDERVDARIPRSRGEYSAGAAIRFVNGMGVFGGLSLQHASGYHRTAAQVGVNYAW